MTCGFAWTRRFTLKRRQTTARRDAGGGWPAHAYAGLIASAVPVQQ